MAWTDEEMLIALHMRDHQGMSAAKVATAMNKPSRAAVLGLVHRIGKETDASDPDNHRNGTMKPDWWKAGVQAR